MTKLTIATRKSQLALAQARAWMQTLSSEHPGIEIEELHVTTSGDREQERPLSEIGGKGLFIKEIEEALIDGRADLAVHSLKDMPAHLPDELVLGCIPTRADPRDVIVTRKAIPLAELPAGARVGTSSLRRKFQLQAARPDLQVVPLRGNVDTRLGKVESGEVDAAILALAGLVRLGLEERASEILPPEVSLPAIGQGALAIEHRVDDARLRVILAPLICLDTAIAVGAERGVMEAVEGNCQMPIAAYATKQGDELWLRAFLAEPDGTRPRRGERRVPYPRDELKSAQLGRELGAELKARES
jgi:hydroxymethylbilane synthase